ncbi:MAG: hypothetical protein IAF08_07335 [Rhizobacter sp.]|nr:hypothetical protein [Chlorobiales bacterium]
MQTAAQNSIKEKVLKAIDQMPATATFEDIVEQIFFLRKIEQGMKDSQEGKLYSQAQVEEHFNRKWQK